MLPISCFLQFVNEKGSVLLKTYFACITFRSFTLNEIAKKLSEKFEVSCEIVDARKKFQQMMKMFEWFEYEGYETSIAELRKVKPQLVNFDAWLQQLEWKDFT
mgnify:CR=1 FL=1